MTRFSVPTSPRRSRKLREELPASIEPMMAVLSDLPSHDANWSYEYKWDGVRAIAFCGKGNVRLQSRNSLDISVRYPELRGLATSLAGRSAVLDGEIVALDEHNRPSFSRLQHRMHRSDPGLIRRAVDEIPIQFIVFDLLHLDGRSTVELPYAARREMLEELALSGPSWFLSPANIGEGASVYASAKKLELEGIVAKRLESTYQSGRRSSDWRKIKIAARQEFVIGGWALERSGAAQRIGALLLGYYTPDASGQQAKLRYCGRVGSGLKQSDHLKLLEKLGPLSTTRSPFSEKPPRSETQIHYVQPNLVAEVQFRGWTGGGILRQPSFKGIRTDKDACAVIRE